jgi:hypothetical protein
MNKSMFVATIIFILILSTLAEAPQIKAASKTIVVPDDYPLIQDAIDSAAAGDTIFVRSGVYYETLVINKSLTLIGENREHTIIDAHKITTDVVHITINDVTFTNFTLGHTGYIYSSGSTAPSGVHLEASYNHVTNNTIVDVHGPAFYVGFSDKHDNAISNNIVINCSSFLSLFGVNNTIVDNTYSQGDGQIYTLPPESSNVVERNVEVDYSDVPSPFPADISLLKGNDVLEISRTKGASLGDLILKDNATLIVDSFDAKADSLHATDSSRVILTDGAYLYVQQLTGATPMKIYLMDNASLNSTNSKTVTLVCMNSSQIRASNSTLGIQASENSFVDLDKCTGQIVASGKANITSTDSHQYLESIGGEAQVWVSNCQLYGSSSFLKAEGKSKLWLINSTGGTGGVYDNIVFLEESQVWVINSSIQIANMDFLNKSSVWVINSNVTFFDEGTNISFYSSDARLIYGWYLNVNVRSPEGTSLENMNVEIYFSNGSLVDKGVTDSDGNVQFILARHIRQKDGDQYFVPYTIKAYGSNLQGEINIDLDSNKEITLTTSIYTPSPTVPTTCIAAAAVIIGIAVGIALLIYFKKRKH